MARSRWPMATHSHRLRRTVPRWRVVGRDWCVLEMATRSETNQVYDIWDYYVRARWLVCNVRPTWDYRIGQWSTVRLKDVCWLVQCTLDCTSNLCAISPGIEWWSGTDRRCFQTGHETRCERRRSPNIWLCENSSSNIVLLHLHDSLNSSWTDDRTPGAVFSLCATTTTCTQSETSAEINIPRQAEIHNRCTRPLQRLNKKSSEMGLLGK